jgi:hypothetical protein
MMETTRARGNVSTCKPNLTQARPPRRALSHWTHLPHVPEAYDRATCIEFPSTSTRHQA